MFEKFHVKTLGKLYIQRNVDWWLKLRSLKYNLKICENTQDEGNWEQPELSEVNDMSRSLDLWTMSLGMEMMLHLKS